MGGSGDAQLSGLVGGASTFDATSLSFSFVPDSSTLFFTFVFASTEYPTFVNSSFNDVFGFFVNGTNVAVIPGTNTPVSVNNVNVGLPVGTAASNPSSFTQYSSISTPYNYGGATVLLTATANVTAGQVNDFRFAIADVSDDVLDSAVLIGAGSFSTTPPPTDVPEPATYALIGAGLIAAIFLRRRKLA